MIKISQSISPLYSNPKNYKYSWSNMIRCIIKTVFVVIFGTLTHTSVIGVPTVDPSIPGQDGTLSSLGENYSLSLNLFFCCKYFTKILTELTNSVEIFTGLTKVQTLIFRFVCLNTVIQTQHALKT